MKSHVSVLFERPAGRIAERWREALEPHRLDEDDPASIRGWHWDYWFVPEEEDFGDGS